MARESLVICFIFNAKRGKTDELVETWNEGISWLRKQGGWVDEKLLRTHDDPNIFMSIMEWTNVEKFRTAVSNPKFQEIMNNLPVKEDAIVASYSVESRSAEREAA